MFSLYVNMHMTFASHSYELIVKSLRILLLLLFFHKYRYDQESTQKIAVNELFGDLTLLSSVSIGNKSALRIKRHYQRIETENGKITLTLKKIKIRRKQNSRIEEMEMGCSFCSRKISTDPPYTEWKCWRLYSKLCTKVFSWKASCVIIIAYKWKWLYVWNFALCAAADGECVGRCVCMRARLPHGGRIIWLLVCYCERCVKSTRKTWRYFPFGSATEMMCSALFRFLSTRLNRWL